MKTAPINSQESVQRMLRNLDGYRLAVVVASTAAGFLFYHAGPGFYAVMACFFAVNLVSLLLLQRHALSRPLSQAQLVADVVLVTCLVHYTGGIDSVFVFLYPLCILAAAAQSSGEVLMQSITGASALFFGVIVLLEYTGVIDHYGGQMSSYGGGPWLVSFLYFFRVFIFGLVSSVGATLMRRLQWAQSQTLQTQAASNRIIGTMNHGVITVDGMEKIIYANEYALEILQRDFSDLSGRDWRTIFRSPGLCDMATDQALDAAAADPLHHELRVMITCPDGGERAVGFNFSEQYDETGQRMSKVILFRDLTELIKARKKMKADEKWVLLGELAGGIVHEIRNPLASIRGSIEVLAHRRVFQDKDKALLNIVMEESDRLNGILENCLAHAGKKNAEKKPMDPAGFLEPLLCMLQGHPRFRKDVKLRWDVPKGKARVCADDQQMRQVLLNIVQNALDAMPGGGNLDIRLQTIGTEGPGAPSGGNVVPMGRWVCVEIEDTGLGMPQQVMDRLYEPFFSTKQNGHGIGLSVCRRIVENHQGFLKVRSEPGKGSVFSVYLPFAPDKLSRRARAEGG